VAGARILRDAGRQWWQPPGRRGDDVQRAAISPLGFIQAAAMATIPTTRCSRLSDAHQRQYVTRVQVYQCFSPALTLA
jgi:hypothetical protein